MADGVRRSRAIRLGIAVALLALVAGLATLLLAHGDDADEDVSLASSSIVTPSGESRSVGSLLGDQPVLVNFWQRSCAPCVRELPLLQEVSETSEVVGVLGVNVQESDADARSVVADTGIRFDWVRDPNGDLFYAAGASGVPTTLLVDTDGTVLARKLGVFDSTAEIDAFVGEHLG